jgi:hypothetical protein
MTAETIKLLRHMYAYRVFLIMWIAATLWVVLRHENASPEGTVDLHRDFATLHGSRWLESSGKQARRVRGMSVLDQVDGGNDSGYQ